MLTLFMALTLSMVTSSGGPVLCFKGCPLCSEVFVGVKWLGLSSHQFRQRDHCERDRLEIAEWESEPPLVRPVLAQLHHIPSNSGTAADAPFSEKLLCFGT